MKQKSMTALVSAFSRAYHSVQNKEKIFDDYLAKNILTPQEYEQISNNMSKGISFFNPSFNGTEEEALKWIVDNQLSPSPLGRSIFTEKSLENAVKIGAKQYMIFAAGYDTFAYRQPNWARKIQIFEIDKTDTSFDKQKRVQSTILEKPSNLHYVYIDFMKDNLENKLLSFSKFNRDKISFCSLLGISYYLSEHIFYETINSISNIVPEGSSIIFDYPDENYNTQKAGERAKKQIAMANAANEKMISNYSYLKLENSLAKSNFFIYEHLKPNEITNQYFKTYNQLNPEHNIMAFDNVNYCLAVKK